jgi:hypothetical protein
MAEFFTQQPLVRGSRALFRTPGRTTGGGGGRQAVAHGRTDPGGDRLPGGDRRPLPIYNPGGVDVDAEVVGFSGERLFLMPTGIPRGLSPNARVIPLGGAGDVAVGEACSDACWTAPAILSTTAARCI